MWQRCLREMTTGGGGGDMSTKTLEINPDHPFVAYVENRDKLFICFWQLSCIASGIHLTTPGDLVKNLCDLIIEVGGLPAEEEEDVLVIDDNTTPMDTT